MRQFQELVQTRRSQHFGRIGYCIGASKAASPTLNSPLHAPNTYDYTNYSCDYSVSAFNHKVTIASEECKSFVLIDRFCLECLFYTCSHPFLISFLF